MAELMYSVLRNKTNYEPRLWMERERSRGKMRIPLDYIIGGKKTVKFHLLLDSIQSRMGPPLRGV